MAWPTLGGALEQIGSTAHHSWLLPKWLVIFEMLLQEALPCPVKDVFLLLTEALDGEWLSSFSFLHRINHRQAHEAVLLHHPVSLWKIINVILLSHLTIQHRFTSPPDHHNGMQMKTQSLSLVNRSAQVLFIKRIKTWAFILHYLSTYLNISLILHNVPLSSSNPRYRPLLGR